MKRQLSVFCSVYKGYFYKKTPKTSKDTLLTTGTSMFLYILKTWPLDLDFKKQSKNYFFVIKNYKTGKTVELK